MGGTNKAKMNIPVLRGRAGHETMMWHDRAFYTAQGHTRETAC